MPDMIYALFKIAPCALRDGRGRRKIIILNSRLISVSQYEDRTGKPCCAL
jgi:hypothetical protein